MGIVTPRSYIVGRSGNREPLRRPSAAVASIVLVFSLAAGTGCTSHMHTQLATADHGLVPRLSTDVDPRFSYSYEEIPFANHVVGEGATSNYTLRELTIPSAGVSPQGDREIRAKYYRSELSGPRPLLITLPIYARFTYPSDKVSTFVQKHSKGAYHVVEVEGKNFLINWYSLADTDDEEHFLDLFREGVEAERLVVIDLRRLIDWAEQQPEIDGDRIGLVGFSRSAIVAGTLATQEPRLAATILVVGGAHPHTIVAHCEGVRTAAVQKNAARQFGWDRDELEARLKPIFAVVDPANYPGRVDPETVLMIEAARDDCVVKESSDALHEAMGHPEIFTLNYGHRTAFLSMTMLGGNWMCDRILEFLDKRFQRN